MELEKIVGTVIAALIAALTSIVVCIMNHRHETSKYVTELEKTKDEFKSSLKNLEYQFARQYDVKIKANEKMVEAFADILFEMKRLLPDSLAKMGPSEMHPSNQEELRAAILKGERLLLSNSLFLSESQQERFKKLLGRSNTFMWKHSCYLDAPDTSKEERKERTELRDSAYKIIKEYEGALYDLVDKTRESFNRL